MSTNQSGTVLLFQDAALRRPIDLVALMSDHAPQDAGDEIENVVSLARFARSSRRARARRLLTGPPEGEAA
jgi:hypothetical protein